MFKSEYLNRVYAEVERRDAHEPEFLQAVKEVFESLELVVDKHPEWEAAGLLERFVQGDESRSKGGSGLGLNIAESLTELMKGKLKLSLDGDLFKVELWFDEDKQ